MAGIRNFQRRALEALMKDRPARTYTVGGSRRYFLEDFISPERREVFLWGISRGIGICSDLHGVDIAVFGEERSTEKIPETSCKSLALARFPLPGECLEDGVARKVVEQLEIYHAGRKGDVDVMVFQRTGRKNIYVNTIC